MMVEREGDIFSTSAAVIGHGCNCRGRMGAGIAVQIRRRYPAAFDAYRTSCQAGAFRPGLAQLVRTMPHWILNMATQERYGRPPWRAGSVWARPEWIESCLQRVVELANEHNILRWAFPRVGCANGGLYWDAADYEAKLATYGPALVPPPSSVFVADLFCRVFGGTRLQVEVWRRPVTTHE